MNFLSPTTPFKRVHVSCRLIIVYQLYQSKLTGFNVLNPSKTTIGITTVQKIK